MIAELARSHPDLFLEDATEVSGIAEAAVTGYQLRDTTVPEPGSTILIAIWALSLLRRRSR